MRKKREQCQYCWVDFDKDKHRKTAEHIFPQTLIALFPEQYIAYSGKKKFIDNNGITISDVCAKCNNEILSPLDNYGGNIIKNNFLEKISFELKDEKFPVTLDYYQLSRWILKILYNFQRSKKEKFEWFHRAKGYMLYDLRVENFDFSLFAGVHINSSPMPEEFFEYIPLQINREPKIVGNSLNIISFGIEPLINSVKVKEAYATYSIRFGTLVLYIILWEHGASLHEKKFHNTLMTHEFAFNKIVPTKSEYNLNRVSAHTNTIIGYNHLISKSGLKQDDQMVGDSIGGQSITELQKYFYESKGKEGMEKTRTLIEIAEFPNNKKVQKKYKQLFPDDK